MTENVICWMNLDIPLGYDLGLWLRELCKY